MKRDRKPAGERCDNCGRTDETVARCSCCFLLGCGRKKCRAQHDACGTPDELVDCELVD